MNINWRIDIVLILIYVSFLFGTSMFLEFYSNRIVLLNKEKIEKILEMKDHYIEMTEENHLLLEQILKKLEEK